MVLTNKEDVYKWIKIAGLISFIPFILAVGPVGGYFIGNFITKKFNLNSSITFIFIILGFAVSISETIKIIKMLIDIEKKS